ncbi:MAG: hypothetical protein PHI60_02695 [Candidatus Omnitrophica bacterium]|nr:hypothetical protein [Candidatus Omnitrophota bacterium]
MKSFSERGSPRRGLSFFALIFIIGSSGTAAQVMLLRELLVSFNGNELVLGIVLANWIIAEALGVFLIGSYIDKVKGKMNVLALLQAAFSFALPLSIYFARTLKHAMGIPSAEAMGLAGMFYSSFLIMLPVSFCHGALFSCCCKAYAEDSGDYAGAIGKTYAWETAGTLFAGVFLTYFLIPFMNSFQIAFSISILNLSACLFFINRLGRPVRLIVAALILFAAVFSSSGALNKFHGYSIRKQWDNRDILDYRNSIYGNITVIRKQGEQTFFYNGSPVITSPHPDSIFTQETAHLPLLFHEGPKDILVIGAGAGGLINEILKHPVTRVDYAESDPLLIEMLERYPTGLTKSELEDERVNIISKDGRFFVRQTPSRYDIILIGLSNPDDLSTNRLFTKEFFDLAKKKLSEAGILAIHLPGSSTYLSGLMRDLNACVLNSLNLSFAHTRVIPGDYNIILASDSAGIETAGSGLISGRIKQRGVNAGMLTGSYLDYKLDKGRSEWFRESLAGATERINQDFAPYAVFQMLLFWNKQFSPGFLKVMEAMGHLSLASLFFLILSLTLIILFILRGKTGFSKFSAAYGIFTTGFFGMLINLILIFGYQVIYGYLYYRIGLFISIFMAGTALGSVFMTRALRTIKDCPGLFIKLEGAIIVFTLFCAAAIPGLASYPEFSQAVFIALFFISGSLLGLEFPLAGKIYTRDGEQVGYTSGVLYFFDLLGGWAAGILGGIVLLPVLGLLNTSMAIAFLKLSSLSVLMICRRRSNPGR